MAVYTIDKFDKNGMWVNPVKERGKYLYAPGLETVVTMLSPEPLTTDEIIEKFYPHLASMERITIETDIHFERINNENR